MELITETGIKKYGKRNYMFAIFRCSCGKELEMAKLRGLSTDTCQECFRKIHKQKVTRHGDRYTRLYRTWVNMTKRCREPSRKHYHGKGISVLPDWLVWENFKQWAYESGYNDNLTIDRIDNNGNYEPNNCQWISNRLNAGKDKRLLSMETAETIRDLHSKGMLQSKLAVVYDVNINVINDIIHNKTYVD